MMKGRGEARPQKPEVATTRPSTGASTAGSAAEGRSGRLAQQQQEQLRPRVRMRARARCRSACWAAWARARPMRHGTGRGRTRPTPTQTAVAREPRRTGRTTPGSDGRATATMWKSAATGSMKEAPPLRVAEPSATAAAQAADERVAQAPRRATQTKPPTTRSDTRSQALGCCRTAGWRTNWPKRCEADPPWRLAAQRTRQAQGPRAQRVPSASASASASHSRLSSLRPVPRARVAAG